MPVQTNYTLARFEDGTLVVVMAPAANIAGWQLQYTMWRRFQNVSGSTSGLITKTAASGFGGGQSGITVTNSGQGQFNVNLIGTDLSGTFDPGSYYWRAERVDSGFHTLIAEGYRFM